MLRNHTSVPIYVRSDLKDSQGVSLDVFLEVLLGLTPADLSSWTSIIYEQEWHKDKTIRSNLKAFCTAHEEEELERCKPLATIINRIMKMARGKLPGVPDTYPIDNICVVGSYPEAMRTIAAHGAMGAIRRPHLVTLRRIHAGTNELSGLKWVNDITSWELKSTKKLSDAYKAFLEDRRRLNRKCNKGVLGSDNLGADSSAVSVQRTTAQVRTTKQPARRTRRYVSTKPADIESHEATATAGPSDVASRSSLKHRIEHNLLDDIRRVTNPLGEDIARYKSVDAASFAAKDASVGAGSYALETLACTFGTRLFCVNISMENDRIYFWYYDACGFVCTIEGVSLIDDFEKAAAIFVGLACCSPERLGALPSIFKPPRSAPYPENWPPEDLSRHTLTLKHPSGEGKVKVTFEQSVFTQYALTGRRTFVYTIKTSPALATGGLIMKLSYQMNTKTDEQKMVKKARDAGVGHLPEIHLSDDLWKMSDGVRRIFLEKGGVEYEDRTLRAIVYSKYMPLQPLIAESPECIPIMTRQIIGCLYDLRKKANILHRDVSLQNIMYTYREEELYFVLIDFDMATTVSTKDDATYRVSSKHRTGTLPFMAAELIDSASKLDMKDYTPIPHFVRHDVESVFWASLWGPMILMEPENDDEKAAKDRNIKIARAWETAELLPLGFVKVGMRNQSLRDSSIRLVGKAKCLERWFDCWTLFWLRIQHVLYEHKSAVFRAERRNLPLRPFDEETLNGTFTRETIIKALSKFEDVTAGTEPLVNADAVTASSIFQAVISDAGPTRRGKRKVTAATKKSPATRKTKKTSTARIKAAVERTKPMPTQETNRIRQMKDRARFAEHEDTRNVAGVDIRSRLRPKKQVDYKM